ncbi:MAG TPA: hypothetical protein VKS20_14555 [Candidatus Acidoferrales bacterium]|nr:hypothetical protein [Candidatus Acidoferrales bacterium]
MRTAISFTLPRSMANGLTSSRVQRILRRYTAKDYRPALPPDCGTGRDRRVVSFWLDWHFVNALQARFGCRSRGELLRRLVLYDQRQQTGPAPRGATSGPVVTGRRVVWQDAPTPRSDSKHVSDQEYIRKLHSQK